MESRIEAELEGYRATLADDRDEKAGIWKTLEGIYPAECE